MTLDTSAYSALDRGVSSIVEVLRGRRGLSVPLPVIAELQTGFLGGNRVEDNRRVLRDFISQPAVSVLAPNPDTTIYYAELQLLARRRGRSLSNNDIWIAALTQQFEETLITYDQDFSVFAELLGDQLLILG